LRKKKKGTPWQGKGMVAAAMEKGSELGEGEKGKSDGKGWLMKDGQKGDY